MVSRNREVRVKLSTEEMKILENKSRQVGLAVSSFLRVVGIKSNIVTT